MLPHSRIANNDLTYPLLAHLVKPLGNKHLLKLRLLCKIYFIGGKYKDEPFPCACRSGEKRSINTFPNGVREKVNATNQAGIRTRIAVFTFRASNRYTICTPYPMSFPLFLTGWER